ncbi:hypothetical protein E2562_028713 [Oryza meyeriana var. granulata]|uniref:Uncharacterized protein n=1 Tax=Oryza meyeriana var. granulata TaxID=110450 RepID=A0A6G1D8V8_9ORYZ|nr:hypothetical protein E2562_028713 [Oryza meyeriana var. granulata]
MEPPLHKAAVQGSTASLQALVKENPKILDSKTPQGNTVLHIAAGFGHVAFAREALATNRDLLVAKNDQGDTPLHLAARSGKMPVAILLIDFIRLAETPWPEEPLLMTNKAGNTPLHEAVKNRRSAVALMLLGAEPICGHKPNKEMITPLHIAAREGLTEVVDKILGQPWVPEKYVVTEHINGTALHQAVLGGHTRKTHHP